MSNLKALPDENNQGERRRVSWPLLIGSLLFGLVALLVAAFFLWALDYWASNTPIMGRALNPPVPSAEFIGGLACCSIPLGFLAVLVSFVFAREAFRRTDGEE